MDLTNASAIVTGGAGGFGSATVRRLTQKGALSRAAWAACGYLTQVFMR